ncbi:MAG: FAD:protein FMN transferase [Planctomycetota bacterium]|nr:MAG: FAD:protein FMN transferase [Planctomycetota bacterium]
MMSIADRCQIRGGWPPSIVYSLVLCIVLAAPVGTCGPVWSQTAPGSSAPAGPATPDRSAPPAPPPTPNNSGTGSGGQSPAEQPEEPHAQGVQGYVWSFPAMGTIVTFKTFHHDPALVEQVFRQAEALVHELDDILTDYEPNSETRLLSQRAVDRPALVSDPLWDVLSASDAWHSRSGGAVDPAIGSLTRLWRKYRGTRRWPNQAAISQALRNSGWRHVHLDPEAKTVHLDRPVQFDFGAIGKGYAVDRAFELLERFGLRRSLVNISGNMRLGDPPPDRPGWRIELAPLDPGGRGLGRVILSNTSIATSGDLWQAREIQGVRRSHILDPRTGWGVAGPRSATAITRLAIDADALATAGCILPPDDALHLANSIGAQLLLARRSASTVELHRTEDFPRLTSPTSDAPAEVPPADDVPPQPTEPGPSDPNPAAQQPSGSDRQPGKNDG